MSARACLLLARPRWSRHPPVINAGPDRTAEYASLQGEDCSFSITPAAIDSDAHALAYSWLDDGGLVTSNATLFLCGLAPGSYRYTVRVIDGRGGLASDTVNVTILPTKEIVLWASDYVVREGNWAIVPDATAAGGQTAHVADLGAPKVTTPLARPVGYLVVRFIADPTQTYKLWVRLKADRNSWANDSIWVQFNGAVDLDGNPVYRAGTTSGPAVNLEECSGCGISGWGWEDDGWGAVNRHGVLLRFPGSADGGEQYLMIQTREDGVSVDQIVLSAEKYLTGRPDTARNDTTILTPTQR